MFIWSKLSSTKWRDAWEERFHGLGQTDAVISELPGRKSIRIEVYCESEEQAETIRREFGGTVRPLKEWNWTHMPAAKAPPIKIRGALLIASSDDKAVISRLRREHPRRQVIAIPPEMAFGTGDHVTTATCLRFLVDISRELERQGEPWNQLDLGCGSGILAIAGKLLGARAVEACDYDARAVRISKRNAKRNGLRNREIRFAEKNVLDWKPAAREKGTYACVTANLFSDVLGAAFPKIAVVTAPGGFVVVSGILADQAEACLDAGEKEGVRFEKVVRRGKWVSAWGRVDEK